MKAISFINLRATQRGLWFCHLAKVRRLSASWLSNFLKVFELSRSGNPAHLVFSLGNLFPPRGLGGLTFGKFQVLSQKQINFKFYLNNQNQ